MHKYVKKMKELGHKDIAVQPSGLTLMPERAFLGATADGIVSNHRYHRGSQGVLEIKCPYSIQKSSVNTKSPSDIAKEHKEFFLQYDKEGKLHLKRTSHYFYQVKGEMAIKKCQWAHFVVWTAAPIDNIFVEEIAFDENVWTNCILPKLVTFYLEVLVPEILTQKIQKSVFSL